MALDKKELGKLSPEGRIKKLREMEQKHAEDRKKESEEIDTLIRKSMEDFKTDEIAKRVAPKPREVDITQLFSEEEMELRSPRTKPVAEADVLYKVQEQLANDYGSLKKMLDYELSPSAMSPGQRQQLDTIQNRIDFVSYKHRSAAEEVNILVSASREALHRIRKYVGLE